MSDDSACSSALGGFRHRWMFDWASPWEYTAHAVRREIFHSRSKFQDIEIVETEGYGRCLLLDGEVQSFELDEYIYHESLVQPAMMMHRDPRRILVIGGGEGATLREVLRHRTVELAVMVDIDEQLIAAAREHLPTFHQGSFNDARAQIRFQDGREFIENGTSRFDVIVIDVTNPMKGGPSYRLFTMEFYRSVRKRLSEGGIVVLQSDAVTLSGLDGAATIYRTVCDVWPYVFSSAVFLPAYTTDWSFTLASAEPIAPLNYPILDIDERIQQRTGHSLQFYDGTMHQRLFHLPRYLREALAAPCPISRDDSPLEQSLPGFTQ